MATIPKVEGYKLAHHIQNKNANKIVKINTFVLLNQVETQIVMSTSQPPQNHDDPPRDLKLWAKQQVLLIEASSKQQILFELQSIMAGHNYSWHCINGLLQAQFDEGALEFSLVDGDVLFEWNNLCDEKRVWEKKGRLSINNSEYNMGCLINLKILPVHAGLGIEGRLAAWSHLECANRKGLRLVNSNMDKPNTSTVELWAGPKDPESYARYAASRLPAGNDTSSTESEDSDYVDEEEEIDDEGVKIKDIELGSDDEESEYCGESSDESDEVKTEDEDSEGFGVRIVDVGEDEISDLEL